MVRQLSIVDFETTGLDAEVDEIIEVGITVYRSFDELTWQFISTFSCLREPGVPISEDAFKAHNITEEMCRGHKIPVDFIKGLVAGSNWLMAHNAPFDYQMAKHSDECDFMCEFDWLDSMNHIDWYGHGHRTRNQNHLLADKGKVNPFPHRASPDTMTCMLVSEEHLDEAIEMAGQDRIKICAYNTPFPATNKPENKVEMRTLGLRWYPEDDHDKKHWWYEGNEAGAKAVMAFLREKIYSSSATFNKNVVGTRATWRDYLDNYKTV